MTLLDTIYLALLVCYLVEVSGAKGALQRMTGRADILPLTSVTAMTFIVCTAALIVAGAWSFAMQAFVCLLSAASFPFSRAVIFIKNKLTKR